MRPFSQRSRGALTALVVLALLLAVPAPALSAAQLSPGRALEAEEDDGLAPSPPSRATAKWTYLLYISADNNLEDEAILNFNQLEEVGSSADLNIVLQLDRSPEYDETNGNWTGTRRYYVLPDTDPDIINSQLLDDMGEVDMGKADNLRDFVVWAVTSYPAERYYLDVWGHGGGWRDGTCNDYTSGSVIDLEELGKALEEAESRTNETLDGLGFDQCLMAQLEVFYEIKARADVLVGAETLIPADGYNYTRVMRALAADPDMDAAGLADVIVSAFFDQYGHDNDRAHSAVDAEELDARLAQAVTRMAQLLRANASSLRDEIKLARDLAQTYSTLDYIDLGNFTDMLLLTLPANETELRRAVAEVGENVTASVVAEDHGIGRGGSTGLSFYFPRYGVAWNYANIQMSREGRWDEFLKAYFDRRDRPNEAPTVAVSDPHPVSVVGLEFSMKGVASDTDGNVTHVEWKFDKGRWSAAEAGERWQANVSTAGVDPGLHRVSVRSRDNAGDYSPEVQFTLNVESKGLELLAVPGSVRTYPGGYTGADLLVSAFGEEGSDVSLEVSSKPGSWTVDLPFDQVKLAPHGSANGTVKVAVDKGTEKGPYQVVVRAWVTGAPLIQAFAVFNVDVTERWADLVVVDLAFSPEEPGEGEVMTINFSVVNTGLAPALSFDVELVYRFEPDVNASSSIVRRLHVDRLDVGERVDVSESWRAVIGTHEFVAEADGIWNNTDLDRSDNGLSRILVLHGYAVMLEAFPEDVNVTPGDTVHFSLLLRNEGNLWDTLVLSHVNSELGWTHRFNSTVFSLDPKQDQEADLWVDVPEEVLGGSEELITIRLASTGNLTKYHDVVLGLFYPEVFGLSVTQDREKGKIGPLADDSFNVTIENTGNGHEVYDLEYIRQLDHLFISAVNDTVELAPGCSTAVEVFFSTLDTDVGGQSFEFEVRVRSRDDPTTVVTVPFNVTVSRVFGIEAEVIDMGEAFEVQPGTPLLLPLEVTNTGNYPVELEVQLVLGDEVFSPPPAVLGKVYPGTPDAFTVVLVPRPGVLMGTYDVTLMVREAVNIRNNTSATTRVEVERVDSSSLRVNTADASILQPGAEWHAQLLLANDGNHVETYSLNTSFVPKWLGVELSREVVTLEPGSETTVEVTVRLREEGFDAPNTVMVVVNSNPTNDTGGGPKAVLDVALDVPPAEDAPWSLVAFLLAATVVVLAVLVYIRSERLRS